MLHVPINTYTHVEGVCTPAHATALIFRDSHALAGIRRLESILKQTRKLPGSHGASLAKSLKGISAFQVKAHRRHGSHGPGRCAFT